ncbi:flavin monoamine oxidase family protein [Lichenifustis flavocetrariae]|uniref:Tryptophan 2-monooxygenase n=1 Tax=Lichenifustis flavocetrariae TaxID=2949735 RepID=A0AA41Z6S9_9HYPH|nr:FAD-dependent oxidoreductase [Lichenifustis flavocetrariae]MCW6511395.1 FAD-dependent oxidoreductase [Lichenifustis flavocetrariae]
MPALEGWIGHTVDVAVIGAGAAGLATARHLAMVRPDLSVVVIEAARRIGGRAWTLPGDLAVDLGCGWLHGARDNAWTGIAQAHGFALDTTAAPWNRETRDLRLSPGDQEAAKDALRGFFERVDALDPVGADDPLSAYLEPGNRWNGLIGAIGTYINGVELEQASARDYARYDPGRPPDWRVRDGYGRLIADYGAPVPVVLDTAVSRIAHADTPVVSIETSRGPLRCRTAVVTVSTTCLAEETIRFDPPLPDKLSAAASLPLGVANKLFLDIAAADDLPFDTHVFGTPFRLQTAAYQVRPFGRPVIEAYFGGTFARDIEAAGSEAAFDFAAGELAGLFGSGIRARLSLHAMSAWAGARWSRGSYSCAKPGAADARAVLAAPVGERLFFAGEACSPARFSTAHGAYETGIAAAEAIARGL